MAISDSFESIKNKAAGIAQAAATRAKNLAQIAKANIDIRNEESKQKEAYLELGKLFYRDYMTGEESDEAEYLPWCDKISESVKKVTELRDLIEDLKAGDEPADAEAEPVDDVCECVEEAKEAACECVEEAKEAVCECAEEAKEAVSDAVDEAKPEE